MFSVFSSKMNATKAKKQIDVFNKEYQDKFENMQVANEAAFNDFVRRVAEFEKKSNKTTQNVKDGVGVQLMHLFSNIDNGKKALSIAKTESLNPEMLKTKSYAELKKDFVRTLYDGKYDGDIKQNPVIKEMERRLIEDPSDYVELISLMRTLTRKYNYNKENIDEPNTKSLEPRIQECLNGMIERFEEDTEELALVTKNDPDVFFVTIPILDGKAKDAFGTVSEMLSKRMQTFDDGMPTNNDVYQSFKAVADSPEFKNLDKYPELNNFTSDFKDYVMQIHDTTVTDDLFDESSFPFSNMQRLLSLLTAVNQQEKPGLR